MRKVVFLAVLLLMATACILNGCNVTRTVTTTAQHYVSGDTTTTIITRTVESYDGKMDATKLLELAK